MKKLIIASFLAVFLFAGFQSPASANHFSFNELIFNFFKFKCEFKFKRCYTDRSVAEEAIDVAQMVPPDVVEDVCDDFCNSAITSNQRNTIRCSDEQCADRCTVLSGVLDNNIMALIDNRNFSELRNLCQ